MADDPKPLSAMHALKEVMATFLPWMVLAGGIWAAVNFIETHLADHDTRLRVIEADRVAERAERLTWQAQITQTLMEIRQDLGRMQGAHTDKRAD